MTLVVPFDGSPLAEAALVRATEFGIVFEEDVLAVSVIPKGNAEYAREHDWIEANEDPELKAIVSRLHRQVTDLCPTANFRHRVVDKRAPSGEIAKRLRKVAEHEDASMVFIGSENAGHLVTSLSSVGSSVAAEESYDVVIVRDRSPAKIAKLKDASPHRKGKSDFYLPD
ncbi:Nucleotide-binding universal stress protein, UspA family [Halorientalis persicus]|jgi:nucleotide-binding universal stress UspA family protein|uniref:Nucleotide-binding universal stress protein, UspA family n=1 Tax=Halorientalis persicus TaxID=1367881 RepID=A0A1H8PNB6_9EURY|nr:universal stress protein [Halorientalis persicus]SEO43217.1 Nucleotide-binding universal stress protein, UspA family [Halorientalis persicus]